MVEGKEEAGGPVVMLVVQEDKGVQEALGENSGSDGSDEGGEK